MTPASDMHEQADRIDESVRARTLVRADVVTLCGSMRFYHQILRVAADETAAGRIVLAPFVVSVTRSHQDSPFQAMLDELHRQKIRMSDWVIVVSDETGYYGDSTRAEITYAAHCGIPVTYRTVGE
jgi:hypothetical protein